MTTQSEFKNFAVFTVDIRSVEQKISKGGQNTSGGRPYAVAAAMLPMEDEPMPLRVVAVDGKAIADGIAASITTGQHTLVGRLGYDEKDGKDTATKEQSIVFFPTKVEPAPSDGKLRNYVILTLRAGQNAESRYSDAGNFWTRVRMALSQGKDSSGNYKPSLWLTVKGFTSKEGDETVPQALARLNKGDLATITGRLAYEVSTSNGKGYFNLMAFKVEALQPVAAAEVDCPY